MTQTSVLTLPRSIYIEPMSRCNERKQADNERRMRIFERKEASCN